MFLSDNFHAEIDVKNDTEVKADIRGQAKHGLSEFNVKTEKYSLLAC